MANIGNNLILSSNSNKLKPEIIESIEFICVFGKKGNVIIFITNNDKVFAFGGNHYGWLGLGHNNAVEEPEEVMELSDKQVVDICNGLNFMIALTKTG